MSDLTHTLKNAYSLAWSPHQALTPELTAIRCFFISEEYIEEFQNDELYLSFLQTILNQRNNISFPDKAESYRQYIRDCISLKNLMEKGVSSFMRDRWLDYVVRLLENLKTPYYECYFQCLYSLEPSFSSQDILDHTLSSFYSLMIKSNKQQLKEIERLISYAPSFAQIEGMKDQLLSDILIENLSLLCQEKAYWLPACALDLYSDLPKDSGVKINSEAFLGEFMDLELQFTKNLGNTLFDLSFSFYLAKRKEFMRDHRIPFHDRLLFTKTTASPAISQTVDSEFLNTYAYNMNQTSYITNPAIGRETEISDLELILISPKKSPILLGEAGVGKTSVVEGLAYRLQQGNVPKLLKSKKIFKLTTTALLSGTKYVGEMEERMKQLTRELKEHPDVILFIDEIHTVVGAGSTESSNNDISNMLKPYIDRGEIKIIGATTKEEYDIFLAKDKALSRRFYPIYVDEPDEDTTYRILYETIPSIEYATSVKNIYNIEEISSLLKELISITRQENQIPDLALYRPELPLTLLEMAFSYAALDSRNTFTVQDLRKAILHSSRLTKETRFRSNEYFL